MIKILSSANNNEWHNYLTMLNAEDIYFSPEYLDINEEKIKGKTECFICEGDDYLFLYPYLKRSISQSIYFDITSAYGYGGYIGWPQDKEITEFRADFHQYCIDHNIVSEFIRFHPFYYNHLSINYGMEYIENYQPIVYADFSKENNDIKKMINKEVWKKIRKAERKSVDICIDNQEITYQEFDKLYNKTMTRLKAKKFYFFNENFFQSIRKKMASSSNLFIARYRGLVVGGLWILFGKTFSYNFLSCSDANYPNLGINDLLQWRVLEWAYHSGKQKHLLGGGRKGEDSLFRFKAKFSPERKNYYLGKIIHLPEVYTKLCERINYSEKEKSEMMGWFPYYRSLDADNFI